MAFGATALATSVSTGSLTVENSADGKTYELYKLFDATASGSSIAYSLRSGVADLGGGETWFDLDGTAVTAKTGVTSSDIGSDAFATWAQSYGELIDSQTGNGGELQFTNVPYGYYFVTSELGTVLTVDSVNGAVKVQDKNDHPTFTKVALDENGNALSSSAVSLGDTIQFKISGTTKNYVGEKKIWEYIVEDTLSGQLSYVIDNQHPFTVKVGGNVITNYTLTPARNQIPNGQTFKITIPWASGTGTNITPRYAHDAELEVTYFAKLDPAKISGGIAAENTNTAKITWNDRGGNVIGETPPGVDGFTVSTLYSAKIEISKTDGKTQQALTGAAFTLTSTDGAQVVYTSGTQFVADNAGTYWKLVDGKYTTTNPNTPGINQNAYESLTQKYRMVTVSEVRGEGQTGKTEVSAFVDNNGKLTFAGLGIGTYTLTESVVPTGYNKAEDVTFTISFDPTTGFDVNNSNITLSGTNNENMSITIENNAGIEMPSTGGIGTTIFYILGAVLMIGAGVVIITRRRMSSEG